MPGNPETLLVFDANCPVTGDQTLTHEMKNPDGSWAQISFKRGVGTPLAFAMAMRFISRDPCWTAKTEDGKPFVAKVRENDDPSIIRRLEADECKATFDELTQDALISRAVILPGGESFNKSTKKTDLVAFLIAKGEERVRARNIKDGLIVEKNAPAPNVEVEDVENQEELDAMFGDEQAA